ncbi:hypothetical protein ACQ4PT_064580 [Festuca glaucescens]
MPWSAPPVGWIKLNTDGSFKAVNKEAGAGVVARDAQGVVLFAACAPLPSCDNAEEAEARAVMLGINLLSRHAPAKVLIELDCQATVAALQAEVKDKSRLWAIYQEAKEAMSNLQECVVTHSKRCTNSVADALAKLATSYGHRVMTDILHLPVRDLVKSDTDAMSHDNI